MNILVVGVGAFWFAILRHIWKNQEHFIYAYERDEFRRNFLRQFKKHPYFFKDKKISDRIIFTEDTKDILWGIDIIILALPCQFIPEYVNEAKDYIKEGTIILNLSKGINNKTLRTTEDEIADILKWKDYKYAVLSGGMIASEVVYWTHPLGADIGVNDDFTGEILKDVFQWKNLEIKILKNYVKNIELYWALKNMYSLVLGYYEWAWYEGSSIGYYFSKYYQEFCDLVVLCGGKEVEKFDSFSLAWDLITSCFWDSRNNYFWRLLGSGKSVDEVKKIMESEKKTAEGYETFKAIYKLIKDKEGFAITKQIATLLFEE